MDQKNKSFYLEKIKILLDIDDTDIYDSKIEILLSGAINTLKKAGIPEIETDSELANNYAICLALETSKLMDMDFDSENLQRLYVTSVVTLRTGFINEK